MMLRHRRLLNNVIRTERNKMIFNRNKEQLVKIIKDKIEEKKEHYNFDIVKQQVNEQNILGGKISILHWVLEVLDNPKKWDER